MKELLWKYFMIFQSCNMKIVKYTIKGFFCLTEIIAVKLKQCMKCSQTRNSWRVRSVYTIPAWAEALIKIFSYISNVRYLQNLNVILNSIMSEIFLLWIDSFLPSVSACVINASCRQRWVVIARSLHPHSFHDRIGLYFFFILQLLF